MGDLSKVDASQWLIAFPFLGDAAYPNSTTSSPGHSAQREEGLQRCLKLHSYGFTVNIFRTCSG